MFEVFAGWLADIGPAFTKRVKPSIQTLRNVGDRAAQMCQDPIQARKPFNHTAENQSGCGQRRVKHKSDEWSQPEVSHPLDVGGIRWVDEQDSAQLFRLLIQAPETFVAQGNAIDVAENHCALEAKLLVGSLELNDRCLGLVQRERGERGKSLRLFLRYCCEGIVDQSR